MRSFAPIRVIQIDNFRGIRRMDLEFDPHVTVLFGPNAAGKTSILDALAIGLGAVVSRVPKVKGRSFAKTGDLRIPWMDRPELGEKSTVASPFTAIQLESGTGLKWSVVQWRSPADRARVKREGPGLAVLHEIVDPLVRQVLDARMEDPSPPVPLLLAYGTERAMVDFPLRERDFHKEFNRLAAFDNALTSTTRFKTVFEWFRVMEDEERREQQRRKDFDYRLPELNWVRDALEKAELGCSNPRVKTRPLRMIIDFRHEDGSLEELDVRALSDGYRTHFSLVVDIARRMVQLNPSADLTDSARGTNTTAVILIDEVDLHLDPTWQARVVKGLRQAFPNAQFILTTHSEQVIGSVPASCVRKLFWQDGEIGTQGVPFAQGSTGERILIDLMGASERVSGPVTLQLDEYVRLVSAGEGTSGSALMLRQELERAIPGDERLFQADLEMQRRALMDQFRGGRE